MQRVLVFDTETTGLFRGGAPAPHLTQLAFAVFDRASGIVETVYSQHVILPAGVDIPDIVRDLTGITVEMCAAGVPLADALAALAVAAEGCDTLVAHNLEFDRRVVAASALRVGSAGGADAADVEGVLDRLEQYCTMLRGTARCALPFAGAAGKGRPGAVRRGFKRPRLVELYTYLFKRAPLAPLHCARADTLYCLACFLAMNELGEAAEDAVALAEGGRAPAMKIAPSLLTDSGASGGAAAI
jgi:DNA polymerase III epsilon subunit-like protein